jgi:hypothetical protein
VLCVIDYHQKRSLKNQQAGKNPGPLNNELLIRILPEQAYSHRSLGGNVAVQCCVAGRTAALVLVGAGLVVIRPGIAIASVDFSQFLPGE